MSVNPFVILLTIIAGAGLFVGLILLGPGGGETPVVRPLVSPQISSRVSDELGVARPAPSVDRAQPERLGETTVSQDGIVPAEDAPTLGQGGQNLVTEKIVLPLPVLPSAARPSQIIPPAKQPIPLAAHFFRTQSSRPRPVAPAAVRPPPPASPRAEIETPTPDSFSVFDHTPELRDLRQQMVADGVLAPDEFVKINTNDAMEAFMLKLVEWQARKASSTPEQIEDARGRITRAYAELRSGVSQQ